MRHKIEWLYCWILLFSWYVYMFIQWNRFGMPFQVHVVGGWVYNLVRRYYRKKKTLKFIWKFDTLLLIFFKKSQNYFRARLVIIRGHTKNDVMIQSMSPNNKFWSKVFEVVEFFSYTILLHEKCSLQFEVKDWSAGILLSPCKSLKKSIQIKL